MKKAETKSTTIKKSTKRNYKISSLAAAKEEGAKVTQPKPDVAKDLEKKFDDKVKELNKEEKKVRAIPEIADAVVTPAAEQAKHLQLHEEGTAYKTFFTKKFLERKKWQAPDITKVLSHIPGSVIQIFVKPGDEVRKGSKLMIYEAMKMKNVVNAPYDGKIKEVNVKVGEHLPKDSVLVTYEKFHAAASEEHGRGHHHRSRR
jgi:biotin carboxyl carrier protein